MKIFITGIAGFLGSHLANHFILNGHEVKGIDNLIGGDRENVPHGVPWLNIDCKNYEAVKTYMEGTDVVYHTACYPHEGLSVFSPYLIADSVLSASNSVFAAASHNKVKRVINCSSMARYGNQPQVPFEEWMVTTPVDPYGIAKVAAEETLKVLSRIHGFEYVIAVPHNIYGPNQKYDDPFRNVCAIMLNRALQGKQPIIYGDGNSHRCFSYIDDVIEPLARMATADVHGRVINIGPEQPMVSINSLARMICVLTDLPFNPTYVDPRPTEVKHANCSAKLSKELLGYEARTSLDVGLHKLMDWIKSKGTKDFKYHLNLEIINERTPKTWTQRIM